MPSDKSFELQNLAFADSLQKPIHLPSPSTEAILSSFSASDAYEGNLITFKASVLPLSVDSWLYLSFSGAASWKAGDLGNAYFTFGSGQASSAKPISFISGNFGAVVVPAYEKEVTLSIRTTINNDGASAVEDVTVITNLGYFPFTATAKIYDLTTAAPDPFQSATIKKVTGYNGFEGSIPLIFHVETGSQNSGVERSASIRLAGKDVKGGANFIEGSDLGNYADMNDPRYFSSVFKYTNGVRYDPLYKKLIIPAGVTKFDVQLNTINDADKGPELARLWVGDTWGQATLFDGVRGKSDFDGADTSPAHATPYLRTEANPVMMA